jgi:hypothetical protein
VATGFEGVGGKEIEDEDDDENEDERGSMEPPDVR